ncbi:MAG: hypothetical protein AB8G17_13150 [Gammaproteobacteria bacterium]
MDQKSRACQTQYPINDHRPHDAGDDPDFTAAVLAHFNVNSERALEAFGPGQIVTIAGL